MPSDLFINGKDLVLMLKICLLRWVQHLIENASPTNFELIPQPSFNKNFNLLIDDLVKNQRTNSKIIYHQAKQRKVIQIFEDIRDVFYANPQYFMKGLFVKL